MLRCVVTNVVSPAVESSLSAAPLAPGKDIVIQHAKGAQVFEAKETEHRIIFFTSELV